MRGPVLAFPLAVSQLTGDARMGMAISASLLGLPPPT